MAQATFSWPFGPIHLERYQGAAQDERFALIFALPTPSGPPGHLPLTGGVGPGPHFYGGRQLGKLGGYRKGAGGSVDWFLFYYRCR